MLRNLLNENHRKSQNPIFRATPDGLLKFQLLNAPIGLHFDLAKTDFLDIIISKK